MSFLWFKNLAITDDLYASPFRLCACVFAFVFSGCMLRVMCMLSLAEFYNGKQSKLNDVSYSGLYYTTSYFILVSENLMLVWENEVLCVAVIYIFYAVTLDAIFYNFI